MQQQTYTRRLSDSIDTPNKNWMCKRSNDLTRIISAEQTRQCGLFGLVSEEDEGHRESGEDGIGSGGRIGS